jgi:opacity protein-like surface antigen
LTGRLGYLVAPNWLIYGQGGAAWTKAEATAFNGLGAQVGSISGNSRTGWTAGGGVEWMFVPHWSVFLEYNYMGFGTRSSSFAVCPVGTTCGIFSAKGMSGLLSSHKYMKIPERCGPRACFGAAFISSIVSLNFLHSDRRGIVAFPH